ncbi:MAG: hypothetical protein ACJ8AS_06125 [Hyphomicrobiales bacterium]
MSADEIRARYREFAEKAGREPVVHVSEGRPTLVTISFEQATHLPGLREMLSPERNEDEAGTLLHYLGRGRNWSRFSSDDEIEAHIRSQRDAWR